ncbi:hypothetical protein MLD38_018830 [Melastoma candidum]|uniref:Uncharacterized protein n=1 Tax=Melastoma candidum TaxID=119954 RepID=A0ACB9QV18_9MYRT|nr:hypothetical protein MLD38_018830 [Melastoma candidum]
MDGEVRFPNKQERSRMRWTADLDKIFADLIVGQIQQGVGQTNVLNKKTWSAICCEFNRKTGLNFNRNQLRKHFDVLRTRFYSLRSPVTQNQLPLDDSCGMGFDFWDNIAAQQKPESGKAKDCPIYEQLCIMFTDTAGEGKYAQSSHYEELDKPFTAASASPDLIMGDGPEIIRDSGTMRLAKRNASLVELGTVERKKKRPGSGDGGGGGKERLESMARAMQDMVASSKLISTFAEPKEDLYSISNCIKTLDEMEDIDAMVYFAAVDIFEDPNLREVFMRLNDNDTRLTWLRGRCSNSPRKMQ